MNSLRFTLPSLHQAGLGLLLLTVLAGCGTEQGQSLGDRRRAINDGSAPGVVLIPARTKDSTPSAAQAPASEKSPAPVASPSAGAAKSAATDAAESKPGRGLLEGLPPPSGRPMNSAKDLKAPDLGIPIATGKSASQPATGK